jgi:hypothetical protein
VLEFSLLSGRANAAARGAGVLPATGAALLLVTQMRRRRRQSDAGN